MLKAMSPPKFMRTNIENMNFFVSHEDASYELHQADTIEEAEELFIKLMLENMLPNHIVEDEGSNSYNRFAIERALNWPAKTSRRGRGTHILSNHSTAAFVDEKIKNPILGYVTRETSELIPDNQLLMIYYGRSVNIIDGPACYDPEAKQLVVLPEYQRYFSTLTIERHAD